MTVVRNEKRCIKNKTSLSLPPHEDAENDEGDDADGDGARDDDARLPGVTLRHVGRADERRSGVAQRRPADDLDVGELAVEDDGAVVDAPRGAADLELVRVDRRQVVHDVLWKKELLKMAKLFRSVKKHDLIIYWFG